MLVTGGFMMFRFGLENGDVTIIELRRLSHSRYLVYSHRRKGYSIFKRFVCLMSFGY